jgi:hypothetical protein
MFILKGRTKSGQPIAGLGVGREFLLGCAERDMVLTLERRDADVLGRADFLFIVRAESADELRTKLGHVVVEMHVKPVERGQCDEDN